MPPSNVDMSVIREAMARRGMGGVPAGGTTLPAASQQTAPSGMTPAGGPNTPTVPPPQMPPPQGGAMPQAQPGAPQGPSPQQRPQSAQPNFDDDTKVSAKALMQQLLKYM